MKPGVFAITLAVADLERSLRFYRDGLGLASPGIVGTEFPGNDEHPAGAVAMFTMDDGLVLSLYPATELAKDAHLPLDALRGHGFSLGHRVETRAEVDAVLAAAHAAGATITAPAHERPWQIYSGYFADPDGHLWEVVCFLDD
jgi:catechol 2,3-dioxygenase-like lactoylglutathione lyase family enzyme